MLELVTLPQDSRVERVSCCFLDGCAGEGSRCPSSFHVGDRHFLPTRGIGIPFGRGTWMFHRQPMVTVHYSCPLSAVDMGRLEPDFNVKSQRKASSTGRI